jgi:hypothetical protein
MAVEVMVMGMVAPTQNRRGILEEFLVQCTHPSVI